MRRLKGWIAGALALAGLLATGDPGEARPMTPPTLLLISTSAAPPEGAAQAAPTCSYYGWHRRYRWRRHYGWRHRYGWHPYRWHRWHRYGYGGPGFYRPIGYGYGWHRPWGWHHRYYRW